MDIPEWLQAAALIGVTLSVVVGIQRRREAIRHRFRQFFAHILFPLGMYMATAAYLVQAGRPQAEAILVAVLVLVFFMVLADKLVPRQRSRHVRRVERRKAIATFERETGQKYSPRRHDIDHVVPFSRGGNNTAENLRVLPRSQNRSKGARSPWWDLLGGRSRR
ncbi:MAG: HNH endonuclease signature motif containing protein [Nitrospirota bacterium]